MYQIYIYEKIKIRIKVNKTRGKNENSDDNQIIIDEKNFNVKSNFEIKKVFI